MGEGETTRLVAWFDEMRTVHGRLRRALDLARGSAEPGAADDVRADLLVWCRGFCTALSRHHTSEDTTLFPELERRHPELGATLRALRQDHGMIAYLLADLGAALDRAGGGARGGPGGPGPDADERAALARHLDGVGAIMESHFRYEERALGDVLAALDLDAARDDVLGPL